MSSTVFRLRRGLVSLAAVASLALSSSASRAQGEEAPEHAMRPIEVAVDPRIELLSIVARLAGFREYDQPNSRSPYADEVEAHFGPLRAHTAVSTLQRLRAEKGISNDAIPSLALHLEGVPAS